MVSRRDFLKFTALSAASTAIYASSREKIINKYITYPSERPPIEKRNFTSIAVENKINDISSNLSNKELSWIFQNCFPNTLDTTVQFELINEIPDTFVITGDINAMWLRDSSAQVWPYIKLAKNDQKLLQLLAGVVNRQVKCILIDPYANAFNKNQEGSYWEKDLTDMKKELHERKWEIDSLCYPIRLTYNIWEETGYTKFFTKDWLDAAKIIYNTFKTQQRFDGNGPYKFERKTAKATDTLALGGIGYPVSPNGLIYSAFRPSDDACVYHFLIPSNLFASKSLEQISEIAEKIYGDKEFSKQSLALSKQVEKAVYENAVFNHPNFGDILAYEIDGFGNKLFMDDANVPSLLALPYLGLIDKNNNLYKNTRNFVLSKNNPFFFKSNNFEGIGGPHVAMDYIWPMSIIMRAFTSDNETEIKKCLKMLLNSHANTGFMHESFHKDDPKIFTRKWFAWANTLFGELIIKLAENNIKLLNSI